MKRFIDGIRPTLHPSNNLWVDAALCSMDYNEIIFALSIFMDYQNEIRVYKLSLEIFIFEILDVKSWKLFLPRVSEFASNRVPKNE